MSTRHAVAVLVSSLVLFAGRVVADDREAAEKADKVVRERLKQLKGDTAKVEHVTGEQLSRAFPKLQFFAARFPLYPVARRPPEGLNAQNLFAVDAGGKLKQINDAKGLQEYFGKALKPVKEDKQAKDAVLSWLLLTEQLQQDGYYEFKTVEEATKVAGDGDEKKATARAVVMKGGNGEIGVTLTFDKAGKLTKATEKCELKPGPRPKCHATKLLDPDPVVRAIVEQDLLIMGRAAKDYLDEQRAKSSPELRQAIDRIWKRILDSNR
jgi:hypothetical protein